MGDDGELEAIVVRVLEANPDVVERIRGGNPKAIGALMGPVMRETKGRADGGEVHASSARSSASRTSSRPATRCA